MGDVILGCHCWVDPAFLLAGVLGVVCQREHLVRCCLHEDVAGRAMLLLGILCPVLFVTRLDGTQLRVDVLPLLAELVFGGCLGGESLDRDAGHGFGDAVCPEFGIELFLE